MAIYHRKLLPEYDSNQTTRCSDCDYETIYWPPEAPALPSSTTTSTHISPYLIIVVSLVASFILFISYYLITIRYCARFRQQPTTHVNQETLDFMNHDQQPELDHPIWYITTIGLEPSVINSIKVVKFKKGDGLIKDTSCSVCLSDFEDDESLRLLPKCKHLFHIRCIDTWLRSRTNCPLCRDAVVSNNSNMISQSNDQWTFMEIAGNDGDFGLNDVQYSENHEEMREMGNGGEIQELKPDIEIGITLRRSLSMDSGAEINSTESSLSNSSTELGSLNDIRDSRTRRMMMMVRSFSYSGR